MGIVVAGVLEVSATFFAANGDFVAVLGAFVAACVPLLVTTFVFFTGGTLEELDIEGIGFFATVEVPVVFVAEVLVVDAGVVVLASLAGAFLTGAAVTPALLVVVAVALLTGVTDF